MLRTGTELGIEALPFAPGGSLADILRPTRFWVRQPCGGHGRCGGCRARITQGVTSDPTAAERRHLTQEQIQRGTRLACRVTPAGDMTVEIIDPAIAWREPGEDEYAPVSAMMVHTARGENGCLGVRRILKERGLEDRIRIIVGGAPFRFDHELYKTVQADAWADDGVTAGVAQAKEIIAGRGLTCGVINDIRLIDCSREEIRNEVRRLIEAGMPGGRFLFGTLVMPLAIPEENIRTMLDAAYEYGSYVESAV